LFAEGACVLLDIHDGRLYKETGCCSFAEYVSSAEWLGMGLRQAQCWVAAGRFIRSLPAGSVLPVCERQVRPLVGCDRNVAIRAWVMAWERACVGGLKVSGRLVEDCIVELTKAATDDATITKEPAANAVVAMEGSNYPGSSAACNRPVFLQSHSNEWYSPDDVLDRVKRLFEPRGIDLDPCSTADANTRVGALTFFDLEANGLADENEWRGNVYINPPFGVQDGQSLQSLFFSKCIREYHAGRIAQAVVLLKAAVGYSWFPSVLEWPVCFVTRRLSFVRPPSVNAGELQWGAGKQNPHGSVVVYMGPDVARFVEIFREMGGIPGVNAWAHVPVPVGGQ
jgi:hypothetical protein